MAPKKAHTTEGSSSYNFKTFLTQEKETKFKGYYEERQIFESHYLDKKIFKDYNFV